MNIKWKYNNNEIYFCTHKRKMNGKFDPISKKIIDNNGFYERDILEKFLRYLSKESIVLYCGANIGNHAVFFGIHCKEVYAFEPFKYNFRLLDKNMKINNIKGKAHKILLSDQSGTRHELEKKRKITKVSFGAQSFKKSNNGKYISKKLDDVIGLKVDFISLM